MPRLREQWRRDLLAYAHEYQTMTKVFIVGKAALRGHALLMEAWAPENWNMNPAELAESLAFDGMPVRERRRRR